MLRRTLLIWLVSSGMLFLGGCDWLHKRDKKKQLQAVARDWCMTVTASQVMPVYPLTEDVQPGDVFLVQMSVEEQRQRFDDTGFLPLDHHLTRLTPEGYAEFYRDMFVVPTGATSVDFLRSLQRGADGKSNWKASPAVGFPTYGFSVSRSAGFNAGIPISGVPIGMSLLNASQARASVTIEKASTIGLDVVPLSLQLENWAGANVAYLVPFARDTRRLTQAHKNVQTAESAANLDPKDKAAAIKAAKAEYAAAEKQAAKARKNYVRIISRVFVTGGVDISIADATSGAAGLDVGKPRPVDLLSPSAPDGLADVDPSRMENSRRAISALNAGLAESAVPTRESGSNADLTPTEVDERTKARNAQLEEARKARQAELDTAAKDVTAKREAAKAAQAELDAANKELSEKKAALRKLEGAGTADPEAVAAAKKAVEDSRKAVREKEAAQPIKDLRAAQGKADVAKAALGAVSEMIPGASVRVTSASSRFVSMKQDFDPPLTIGYHAFDREILFGDKGLYLGPPEVTQDRILDGGVNSPTVVTVASTNSPRAIQLRTAARAWAATDEGERDKQLDVMRRKLYPPTSDADEVIEFDLWSQSAQVEQLETVLRAVGVPVP